VDEAGIDILLVGDSVSMVVHGHDTTLPVTLDGMLTHCQAVARGASRAFLIGDLPFGSYEASTTEAVKSAIRMLKEGGMDAVKLEGVRVCVWRGVGVLACQVCVRMAHACGAPVLPRAPARLVLAHARPALCCALAHVPVRRRQPSARGGCARHRGVRCGGDGPRGAHAAVCVCAR
jgi:hypothetical protein